MPTMGAFSIPTFSAARFAQAQQIATQVPIDDKSRLVSLGLPKPSGSPAPVAAPKPIVAGAKAAAPATTASSIPMAVWIGGGVALLAVVGLVVMKMKKRSKRKNPSPSRRRRRRH